MYDIHCILYFHFANRHIRHTLSALTPQVNIRYNRVTAGGSNANKCNGSEDRRDEGTMRN